MNTWIINIFGVRFVKVTPEPRRSTMPTTRRNTAQLQAHQKISSRR